MDQIPLPKITLEQWAVFRAVVEEGSYARAAERLNKTQSGVSYTIAKLESRLPSPALELRGRKAELTDLGAYLYRQAVSLVDQALAIDRNTALMTEGWEEEISIAADLLTPMPRLFQALHAFSEKSPSTRVRVFETSLSGTDEAILERRVELAIAPSVPIGFLAESLWTEKMVPVVSRNHEIATLKRALSERELSRYRQLVVRDSGIRREKAAGWLKSEQRWTVSHFSSSIEAVKAGLGFAFLPFTRVAADISTGSLIEIPLDPPYNREVPLHLILTDQSEAGPAAKSLADIIRKI